MKCKMHQLIVWLIKARFEREWLFHLLSHPDIELDEVAGENELDKLYPPNTIFIINESVDYEKYFSRYESLGIPYAAIHLSDEYYRNSYEFYNHKMCKWVARNYFHPQLSVRPNVLTFGLGYKDGFKSASQTALQSPKDWNQREFVVSFAGNLHHSFRRDFVQAFANVEPNKFHLTYDGFNSASGLDLHAYRSLMNQSKFVLCPIGHCNIDCFRVYEALEAGAVPITISATNMQRWLYWETLFKMPTVPWIAKLNVNECYNELQKILSSNTGDKVAKDTSDVWEKTKNEWSNEFRRFILEMQK